MKLLYNVVNGVNGVLTYLGKGLRQSFSDYCELETVYDDKTIISSDGSMLTILELKGSLVLRDNKLLVEEIIEPLNVALMQRFSKKGHAFQLYFSSDKDNVESDIEKALAPSEATAKRLGLDIKNIFDERKIVLKDYINSERCYLALWSNPKALLTPNEREKDAKGLPVPRMNFVDGQNLMLFSDTLSKRHESYVSNFLKSLRDCSLDVELLGVEDALREIRRSMDNKVSDSWMPILPGMRVIPTIRRRAPEKEVYDVTYPKLSWQLLDNSDEQINDRFIRYGNRIYAPIYVKVPQIKLSTFQDLFNIMLFKDIPWRISYFIEGDGLSRISSKTAFATFLSVFSADNRRIKRGIEDMKYYTMNNGVTVQTRICLCTWANEGDLSELNRRVEELTSAVESWGATGVSRVVGDPYDGTISSALGMVQGSIATKGTEPFPDALAKMPFTRPTSPWKAGPMILRSPDKKILPYQPFSSLQTLWFELFFAQPGSGKSFAMNSNHLGLCLTPGATKLPRIAILDKGFSSLGLIDMLKYGLPPDKRYQVLHKKIQNTVTEAINPFDTQLCCRTPNAIEKSFIINFLSLLATDIVDKRPAKNVIQVISKAVDLAYLNKSDKRDPEIYNRLPILDRVTACIENFRHHSKWHNHPFWEEYDNNTATVWMVVDFLFEAGAIVEATIAQRFAVPKIHDVIAAINSDKIMSDYGDVGDVETGQNIPKLVSRLLGEAIDLFPVISAETRLDISNARVVALDLQDVSQSKDPRGQRVTAGMYMLSRYVMAKDYYINEDLVMSNVPCEPNIQLHKNMPRQKVMDYHIARAKEIYMTPKRICFDEFHITKGIQAILDQLDKDVREGRKYNVDIMLASQMLDDFTTVNEKTREKETPLLDLATSVFIMDAGDARQNEKTAKQLGIVSHVELNALEHSVHGPRKGGGTFLARYKTKYGLYTFLQSLTLGAIELWALNTTAEDVTVRKAVYEKLSPDKALRILAALYPDGVKQEVERRRLALGVKANDNSVELKLADEIYDNALRAGWI